MSDPRPDPGSERAGESEYGNDTGFAAEAADTPLAAQPAADQPAADQPAVGTADQGGAVTPDEDGPGAGAD